MTVAYCILAHNRAAQLVRLVNRLLGDDPCCLVLLHYDQKQEPFDVSEVVHPRLRMVRERPVYWGGPQLVDLSVDMLQIALSEGCDYAVLLSGQDYPVRAVTELEATLSQYDVWADITPLFAEDGSCTWNVARGRYAYRWWHLDDPARWVRGVDRVVARLLGNPHYRNQSRLPYLVHTRQLKQVWWGIRSRGPGVPIYMGSQWMSLSARAIQVVCSSDPRVRSYFRHVPVADEACLQTVLGNSTGLTFAPGKARFVRWTARKPNPDILTMQDLTAITESGCHFARKFDELVDRSVLDQLDLLGTSHLTTPSGAGRPPSPSN